MTTVRTNRPRAIAGARMRIITVLLALGAIMCGVVGFAAPASAHAVLVRSTPVDGSRIAAAPAQVRLTFDESVRLVPNTARVLSTNGARIDTGGAHGVVGGQSIVIPLHHRVPHGAYVATWRVVSADGHIVDGSVAFGVQHAATGESGSGTPRTVLGTVADASAGLGYIGVVLAFGVAVVGVRIWPFSLRSRRSHGLRTVGLALILIGAASGILLEGPRAAEAGWRGVARLTGVGETLTSVDGIALLVRIALVAVLWIPLRGRLTRRSARILVLVGSLGVLVTIALVGHPAAGADVLVAVPAAVLHLASMSVWLGGLTVIGAIVLPRLRAVPRLPVASFRRWSLTAFVAVVVLIVSGEYQALRQIQPLPSLWQTQYGVTLLVKIGLVLLTLLTALVPQRMLLRAGTAATPDPDRLRRRLRNAVAVEAVLTCAVIVVTTSLVSQQPASQTYGPATTMRAALGADSLIVHLDTTRRGAEHMTVRATDANGRTIRLSSLDATLSSNQNKVAAISVRLRRTDDGRWRSRNLTVPLSGVWTVSFDATVNETTGYATRVEYTAW